MSTFYYYKRPKLHLCNRLFVCSEDSFSRLKANGKITDERLRLIKKLQKYKALTLRMLEVLVKNGGDVLSAELDNLADYGLVIKQFYECIEDAAVVRTETFYCASPKLPAEAFYENKKNTFVWSKDIQYADMMKILAFNQFHIALTKNIPKDVIVPYLDYLVKESVIDGRYKLKGRCFHQGYSHVMALAARDCPEHYASVVEVIECVKKKLAYGTENMPWFILVCENKSQCAFINRKLCASPDAKGVKVYYLLDTDIEYDENPLHLLQTYCFMNEGREIVSETFRVDDWFDKKTSGEKTAAGNKERK